MANELSISGSFLYAKNGIQQYGRGQAGVQVNVAGNGSIYNPGYATSNVDTALPLGGLSAPFGYAWFHNLDATNALEIKTAVAGKKICRLLPGEQSGPFRLGTDVTAPSAIADAGTPLLEYEIFPA